MQKIDFRFWPSTRRRRWILTALLAVALLVRLALWLRQPHQPANDEVEYLAVANDLLAGRGWQFYDAYPWLRAPLYPLWLAASMALFGGDARLALLPNIGLSVMHVWLMWLLGQRLAGHSDRSERVGLWSAAGTACLLTFATFANLWMSETLWNVLWTSSLLAILWWRVNPRLRTIVVTGVLLGLTILTRSVPVLFLPFLGLWMLWHVGWRRGLLHGAVLGTVLLAVIGPWTIRNWQAYGQPILVETGFSFNLWAFSEPPIDISEISAILAAIPNPVERADYASAQGWALLRADPMIVARKPWPNMVYLWRVKPIEDRFVQANYYADISFGYTLVALVFDDFLYVLLLGLALWGLAHAPKDSRVVLALIWVGYVLLTTALTHGEARYRHFLWPVLLPFAALTLSRATVARNRAALPAGLLALVVAGVLLVHYPWRWAGAELSRSWHRWHAERALAADDLAQADRSALAALEARETADGWILWGLVRERLGRLDDAAGALATAQTAQTSYPAAALALGEFWLRHADPAKAREAWQALYVEPMALLDWGWRFTTRPPTSTLDVGTGLEVGSLRGMHPPELYGGTTVRWTSAESQIRLPAGEAQTLLLRIASPRPLDAPPVDARVCWRDRCAALAVGSDWRTVEIWLPASFHPREVTLYATPWQPSASGGDDPRQLGLLLDWAALRLDSVGKP